MRTKSPELMDRIKNFIEEYYFQNGESPSTTKIAEAEGISRAGASKVFYSVRVGGQYRISKKSFDRWLEGNAEDDIDG